MNRATYTKLIQAPQGPFRIISVQHHTLNIGEHAFSSKRNDSVGEERIAMKWEDLIVENDHQEPKC